LNPPHMGPISVRVDVADDQATVVFTAQHSAVRETLEASIPKLREMMGSQHLNLVEANVFQGPASDQGRSQAQNFTQTADGRRQVPMAESGDAADEVEQEVANGRAVASNGLLSLYA
jgi:flagellar hook-length control protein FliK